MVRKDGNLAFGPAVEFAAAGTPPMPAPQDRPATPEELRGYLSLLPEGRALLAERDAAARAAASGTPLPGSGWTAEQRRASLSQFAVGRGILAAEDKARRGY